MAVLGVDGCRGRWAGALLDGRSVQLLLLDDVPAVLAVPGVEVVGIDMPIGPSDDGVRACDVASRAALRGRGGVGAVFPAPVRAVLTTDAYAEARRLSVAATDGRSLSAQSFQLARSIRALDEALGDRPDPRVHEVFPELAFRSLDDRVRSGKATTQGSAERRRALLPVMDVLDALAAAPPGPPWSTPSTPASRPGRPAASPTGRRSAWARATATPGAARCGCAGELGTPLPQVRRRTTGSGSTRSRPATGRHGHSGT